AGPRVLMRRVRYFFARTGPALGPVKAWLSHSAHGPKWTRVKTTARYFLSFLALARAWSRSSLDGSSAARAGAASTVAARRGNARRCLGRRRRPAREARRRG